MTTPEDLLKIEKGVVNKSVGQWVSDVEDVKKAILILISEADGLDLSGLVPQVTALIDSLDVPEYMVTEALAGVMSAHDFGLGVVAHAVDGDIPKVKVSKNSQKAVSTLRTDALDALEVVKRNLAAGLIGGGAQSVLTAVAPVIQSPAKAVSAVTWAVNNSANSAVSKASLEMGETMVWISERGGCVHCLAYSGQRSTKTGFPKDLTFAAKPLNLESGTLPHPPLHNHCRCVIEPGISDEYAEALKRESVRSILKGVKEDSESDKVRIEAAKRLLAKDPVAPASVVKYSKRMVKDFEDSKKKPDPVAKAAAKPAPTPKPTPTPKPVVKPTPKPAPVAKTKPVVQRATPAEVLNKDARNFSGEQKITAAEIMYGTNSKQYKDAVKRFRKK